jgi:hypothetical protein
VLFFDMDTVKALNMERQNPTADRIDKMKHFLQAENEKNCYKIIRTLGYKNQDNNLK